MFHTEKEKASYSVWAHGEANQWDKRYKKIENSFNKNGDIIIMKLKFDKNCGVLTFKINDNKQFIAFNNIYKDNELMYRVAITTQHIHESIQLIEFTTFY